MPILEIAKSTGPCRVDATSDAVISQVWFKSDPVDHTFVYRAVQMQLQSESGDHGFNPALPGSWSWFEVALFKDSDATEPIEREGKSLVWKSHGNRIDPFDEQGSISSHFGVVFDRRKGLFDALEIGHVIGVRVCAQYAGWVNDARTGHLIAKVLDEDIFSPMSWTLNSKDIPTDIPDAIQDGVYSLTSMTSCYVKSASNQQTYSLWFTTPVINKDVILRIEDIQLFTKARHNGTPAADAVGVWCWFDLIILATPDAKEARVKDGRALVWRSHDIPRDALVSNGNEQFGKLFGRDHELLSFLEPGNVVAVRACARFPGWELYGKSARLVVRVSYKGVQRAPPKPVVDWKAVVQTNKKLQTLLQQYLDESNAGALSVEAALLSQELRSDRLYGVGGRPLRLLSLDGGGVRGISSLYVLKSVMAKITGDPNAKPCDYFDMMAGTSTGGLIAIMLGRLRMTVDQCIEEYQNLASKIFNAGILSKVGDAVSTGARFSAQVLEDAIKDVVKRYANNADAPMRDPKDDCKVFVLAVRAGDMSNRVATHLRTYTNKNVEKSFADYTIWQAARATSAAPTYFPRITLDGYEYIDGGVGFNNPILLLMGEARLYFGFAREFECLVTLGTGMEPNVALPAEGTGIFSTTVSTGELLYRMWELTTNSERANLMAQPLCEKGTYYRFNVGEKIMEKHWIETVEPTIWQKLKGEQAKDVDRFTPENWAKITIELSDYQHMPDFVNLTKKYLETQQDRVTECATKVGPKRDAVV